eukprot:scaffold927_cov375-Prasinococcus_capsulatus_cf.AAC.9
MQSRKDSISGGEADEDACAVALAKTESARRARVGLLVGDCHSLTTADEAALRCPLGGRRAACGCAPATVLVVQADAARRHPTICARSPGDLAWSRLHCGDV